jgi:hypothetical protein
MRQPVELADKSANKLPCYIFVLMSDFTLSRPATTKTGQFGPSEDEADMDYCDPGILRNYKAKINRFKEQHL